MKRAGLILASPAFALLLVVAADSDQPGRVREPDFTFVRLQYSSTPWSRSTWAVDYPKADMQFLWGLGKLADYAFPKADWRALPIDSDELFEHPFLYAVEVGYLDLSQAEASRLREYLLRGGFLVVDDFHGSYEWRNFYLQIKKVFPEYEPFELPLEHPVFHCYFDIQELMQVPGYQYVWSGLTWERDGYDARYMGIEDDQGRLMVMINHNVDLGDAWEWAERDDYPREFAHLAFQLGMNYIVYAMTH